MADITCLYYIRIIIDVSNVHNSAKHCAGSKSRQKTYDRVAAAAAYNMCV